MCPGDGRRIVMHRANECHLVRVPRGGAAASHRPGCRELSCEWPGRDHDTPSGHQAGIIGFQLTRPPSSQIRMRQCRASSQRPGPATERDQPEKARSSPGSPAFRTLRGNAGYWRGMRNGYRSMGSALNRRVGSNESTTKDFRFQTSGSRAPAWEPLPATLWT